RQERLQRRRETQV
nr:Chain B, Protein E6 [human papillomavirus 18]8OEP_D Chain D, Protein E6 [human papillomavirus 18]